MNSRTVYSIIGVFGNVGGVISSFSLIIAFFLAPYSEMSFRMKAMSELCLVHDMNNKIEKMRFTLSDKLVYYFGFCCCRKKRMDMIEQGNDVLDK